LRPIKPNFMATYQITVNENIALGENLIALLQAVPDVVTFETPQKKKVKKSNLFHRLDHALADVRLMMKGKKRKKTAHEFLEEIRNEK